MISDSYVKLLKGLTGLCVTFSGIIFLRKGDWKQAKNYGHWRPRGRIENMLFGSLEESRQMVPYDGPKPPCQPDGKLQSTSF